MLKDYSSKVESILLYGSEFWGDDPMVHSLYFLRGFLSLTNSMMGGRLMHSEMGLLNVSTLAQLKTKLLDKNLSLCPNQIP